MCNPAFALALNGLGIRSMRWMLVAYMRRWLCIAASMFLAIAPAEALAAQTRLMILPAATAVGCCIALVMLACAAVAYLMLGRR